MNWEFIGAVVVISLGILAFMFCIVASFLKQPN